MPQIIISQDQDSQGNIIHNETEASVVTYKDNDTVENNLNNLNNREELFVTDAKPTKKGFWINKSEQVTGNNSNTIVDRLKKYMDSKIGILSGLLTNKKDNIVEAINENTTGIEKLKEDVENNNSQLSERVKGVNKIYTDANISELGLTLPCTCTQLAEALADGDIASISGNTTIVSDLPYTYGQLFVKRINVNRVSFEFSSCITESDGTTTNNRYIAYYRQLSTIPFSGWKKVALEETLSLTLLNGWTQRAGYTAPKLSKNGNVVTISFSASGGTVTGTTPIVTIPVGYRPTGIITVIGSNDLDAPSLYIIHSNGSVYFLTTLSSNAKIGLSISYVI